MFMFIHIVTISIMKFFIFICTFHFVVMIIESRNHDNVLNTCFDAKHHKMTPEPETNLYGACKPWRSRACCEDNTTLAFHLDNIWGGFDWNHCPGHNLSDTCRNWFLQYLCFYECSPNTGPWIKEQHISIRNERFQNLPLCQSTCNSWWSACQNDYTCLGNWDKGFNWTTGTNTCPVGSTCQPFTTMLGNATNFCNKIWDHSYLTVPDYTPCMKLNFTGDNPNDDVAKYYADLNTANGARHSLILICMTVILKSALLE